MTMRKQITRSELETMYDEMSVSDVAEKLNMSLAGLYKLLDSAGIPRKRQGLADREKRTVYDIVE